MRILEKLIRSPNVRVHLEQKGLILNHKTRRQLKFGSNILHSVKDKMSALSKRGTIEPKKRYAFRIVHNAIFSGIKKYTIGNGLSAYLNLRRNQRKVTSNWWEKKERKPRKDQIDRATKEKIRSFFLSPQTSREVPNRKDVLKINGEQVNKFIMTMTMKEAFDMFKKQYPDIKLGFTTFKKSKPTQVKRVSETSHKTCLCQTCCNLSLKIEAFQKYSTDKENGQLNRTIKNWNKTIVSNITLCDYSEKENPKAECLKRTCNNCGASKLSEFIKQDIEDQLNHNITWFKWELIPIETENTISKKVTSCVKQDTTVSEFLKELEYDLIKYPGHIFRASWQHKQMQSSIENIKLGEVVMLMDFSENYRCRFQKESQNAYFEQRQVTIHPIMCYYRSEIEQKLVKHSITVVSDDTKHDSHAVEIFENKAIEVLNEQEVEIDTIHKFSDGAAAQYKGKNSFLKLSNSKIPVVRNYFETAHGKSPCDGLGAVLKNSCWNAVKSGKAVLGSAHDVFMYCKKLEHGEKVISKGEQKYISKRSVLYVESKEIKREVIAVKTLVGTRMLHSVRNTGKPLEVEIRNLSCYCVDCKNGKDSCMNSNYVDQWMLKKLTIAEAQEDDQTSAICAQNQDNPANDPPAYPSIVRKKNSRKTPLQAVVNQAGRTGTDSEESSNDKTFQMRGCVKAKKKACSIRGECPRY